MRTVTQTDTTTLRQAAARGVAWKIAAELVTQMTRLALLLILARLLTPADFGVASIVLAFLMFVPVLADLGLGASLIQRVHLTEVDRSTVFWASLPLGTSFMLIGIALSWPLARLFDDASIQPLFAVFSVSFLLASLSAVPNALLMRDMEFKSLELRVIAGTLCGASAAIALAVSGAGPWAIVGGEIVNRFVSMVMLWLRCRWRPSRAFSWGSLRSLFAFGGTMLGAVLLMQFAQTAQNLMVGRFLGSRALGRLTVAQTLILLPFSRVAAPIQEVMFPAFSRMQDTPDRILYAWTRINQVVVAIALPSLAGLFVLAPEFTDVVLSERWKGTAPVIRALAVCGIAIALQRLAVGVLSAVGFVRSLMFVGLASVVLTVVAVLVGRGFGLTVTAAALAAQSVVIQTMLITIAARSVGGRLVDVLRPLARIAIATAIMTAALVLVVMLLRDAGVGDIVVLVVGSIAGAVVFVPLLVVLEPDLVRFTASFVRDRRRQQTGDGVAEGPVAGASGPVR